MSKKVNYTRNQMGCMGGWFVGPMASLYMEYALGFQGCFMSRIPLDLQRHIHGFTAQNNTSHDLLGSHTYPMESVGIYYNLDILLLNVRAKQTPLEVRSSFKAARTHL